MIHIKELPAKIIGVYKLNRMYGSRWHTENRPFSVLSFRLSGKESSFEWKNDKNSTVKVQAGENDVGYFPCGAAYSQSCESEQLICVHFETTDEEKEPQFEFGATELRGLFENLYEVYEKKESGYEFLSGAILCKILYSLQTRRPDLAAKIKALADENFSDSEFSVAEIAAAVHFSETYVRRVFKARYHIGIVDYLITLRLKTAAAMLKSGYYTVKETARACGYADEKYFSVAFRRKFGTKPSKARPRG